MTSCYDFYQAQRVSLLENSHFHKDRPPPLLIADLTENHHSKTRFLIGKHTIFIKIAPLLLIADLTEKWSMQNAFPYWKTAIFMNIAPMVLIPS